MLRIRCKKGILNDIKKGKHRVHYIAQTRALKDICVGDRVLLRCSPELMCEVYVSAVRKCSTLDELLNLEQWKQLTPEAVSRIRSHEILRNQLKKYKKHPFVVFEYELVPPSTSAPTATT